MKLSEYIKETTERVTLPIKEMMKNEDLNLSRIQQEIIEHLLASAQHLADVYEILIKSEAYDDLLRKTIKQNTKGE